MTEAWNLIDNVKNVHPHNCPLDFICRSEVTQSKIISYRWQIRSFETKWEVLYAAFLRSILVVCACKNC